MTKPTNGPSNALRHGLYAKEIVLPCENETDFLNLLEEFRAEYDPNGPTEEELIIDLARWRWIKRRLMRAAQLNFTGASASQNGQAQKGNTGSNMDIADTEGKEGVAIRELIQKASSVIQSELTNLEGMAKRKDGALDALTHERRINVISKAITDVIVPLGKAVQGLKTEKEVAEHAYSATMLAKIIALEGSADIRFEKTLGRLIALQDYKRATGYKQIEHNSEKSKL